MAKRHGNRRCSKPSPSRHMYGFNAEGGSQFQLATRPSHSQLWEQYRIGIAGLTPRATAGFCAPRVSITWRRIREQIADGVPLLRRPLAPPAVASASFCVLLEHRLFGNGLTLTSPTGVLSPARQMYLLCRCGNWSNAFRSLSSAPTAHRWLPTPGPKFTK